MGKYSKFIAAVVVGVNTFTGISSDQVSDWITLGVTILTAAGVYQVPNRG